MRVNWEKKILGALSIFPLPILSMASHLFRMRLRHCADANRQSPTVAGSSSCRVRTVWNISHCCRRTDWMRPITMYMTLPRAMPAANRMESVIGRSSIWIEMSTPPR